jgi:hypothetical protein
MHLADLSLSTCYLAACTWFSQFLCFCALSVSDFSKPEWQSLLHSTLLLRQTHALVAHLPLHGQKGAPAARGGSLKGLAAGVATGDVGVEAGGVLRLLRTEPVRLFVEPFSALGCLPAFLSLLRRYGANTRR